MDAADPCSSFTANLAVTHLSEDLFFNLWRFACGSAASVPLGLLAVEQERLAGLQQSQHVGPPDNQR